MACDKSLISWTESVGYAFCSGSCGGSKQLRWQGVIYHYTNGTTCPADEYKGCC
ncbi:hypothetical protein [Lysinibacillus sphaericus]|uniref:hypothetical protein n=1 Tax=Lysinibacillus sphaericus TaxID=1421 RepID=UPI0012BC1365|nr:hypothetical protein [Lysinibacillus sphaericus]